MIGGRIHKVGDWNAFSRLAANLQNELAKARKIVLLRWALKAEAIAKEFLSTQELATSGQWRPLSIYTKERKSRLGYPDATLIETSTYFQAITSFVVHDTANAGVKRGQVYTDSKSITQQGKRKKLKVSSTNVGQQVGTIAKWQEFGTATIPARPLWQPTYQKVMIWHYEHNDYKKIAMGIIAGKYPTIIKKGPKGYSK